MMARLAILLLLGTSSVLATRQDLTGNPIRKVVTLLQDMSKEIAAEGEKEAGLYDAYMCYCKTTNDDLAKAADEASSKISEVSSKLEEDDAAKTSIDQELAGHKADRSSAQNELAKATAIRNKEAAEFAESEADAKANIAAMAGAIPALEKGMGAASFMQTPGADRLRKLVASSNLVNSFDRDNVVAFLEQRANGDYVPQSGQIVGILKSMKEDMEKSLAEETAEETSAVAGFGDLKAAKSQEVSVASAAIESKTAQSGELAVLVAQGKNALEDSEAELADTQKYIASLKISCEEQQKAWTARQAARAEEVSAISEAISVLNDDDALDVFKKALPSSFVSMGANRMDFLQSRKAKKTPLQKANMILASAASTYKSQELLLISYSMKSKVKQHTANAGGVPGMIDDMVALLKKEGDDDAQQKGWCEGELAKASDDQKAAGEALSAANAAISELKDQVTALGSDISTLELEITALDGSVAEATASRKKENAEYTETMTMNEAASQLIEKAKQRLYKFYNPVLYKEPAKKELTMEEKIYADHGHSEWNEAPAFVQVSAHKGKVAPPPPPATFDAYTKKGEKSTGVLALMDMLMKDLQKDMKTAESEEKLAQQEYESLMGDSAATRAQKAKSITDKSASKATLETKLEEVKESTELSNEQLAQIKTTISNLHGSCDFILENFDLRAEARTNEMESLKNAKAVLLGAH